MSIEERKERERRRLKETILKATEQIISERGVEHLTIRALAERIEYSPRTVYLYFRDKQEVLETLVEQRFRITWEKMRAPSPSLSAREVIRNQIEGHLRMALAHPQAYRVLIQLISTPGHVPGPYQTKVEQQAAALLADSTGISEDIETLRGVFLFALRGIALGLVHDHTSHALTGEESEQRIATAADLLLTGLTGLTGLQRI